MYGKHFKSMYTGSMYGAGPNVFSVWGYVIAHAVKGYVELNPKVLASVIGMSEAEAATTIEVLCQPDPKSRSKKNDGRKLVREGEYLFFVPNHETYRSIRNEEERTEYNRLMKRKERKRKAMSRNMSLTVNDCQEMSAHTEADTETEPEKNTPLTPQGGPEPASPCSSPSDSHKPPGFELSSPKQPKRKRKTSPQSSARPPSVNHKALADGFCDLWRDKYDARFAWEHGGMLAKVWSGVFVPYCEASGSPVRFGRKLISAYLDDEADWLVDRKHNPIYLAREPHRWAEGVTVAAPEPKYATAKLSIAQQKFEEAMNAKRNREGNSGVEVPSERAAGSSGGGDSADAGGVVADESGRTPGLPDAGMDGL